MQGMASISDAVIPGGPIKPVQRIICIAECCPRNIHIKININNRRVLCMDKMSAFTCN